MEKLMVSEAEALEVLGIRKGLLDKAVTSGQLTVVRLGRRKLYMVAALREYVAKLAAKAK